MDPIFSAVASGLELPTGWAFPRHPAVRAFRDDSRGRELVDLLIPFRDADGRAQMVRWYYGLITAHQDIAVGFGDPSREYDPSLAWKPPVELEDDSVRLAVDPSSGFLRLGWRPGPETRSLTGELAWTTAGGLTLDMGDGPVGVPTTATHFGVLSVRWPGYLWMSAGITQPADGWSSKVHFRPSGFDAAKIVAGMAGKGVETDLKTAGLWDFAVGAGPYEYLALVWAALHNRRDPLPVVEIEERITPLRAWAPRAFITEHEVGDFQGGYCHSFSGTPVYEFGNAATPLPVSSPSGTASGMDGEPGAGMDGEPLSGLE